MATMGGVLIAAVSWLFFRRPADGWRYYDLAVMLKALLIVGLAVAAIFALLWLLLCITQIGRQTGSA